jgi:hypothetical protein
MSDWKKLDVKKYAGWEGPMPHFLFESSEEDYKDAFQREATEIWGQYRDILDSGGGYLTLKEMKSAMQERIAQLKEEEREYKTQVAFGNLAIMDLKKEARTHAVVEDIDEREFRGESDDFTWENALDLPISNYLTENRGENLPSDPIARLANRWSIPSSRSPLWDCVQLPNQDESNPEDSVTSGSPRIAVIYRPPEDHLRLNIAEVDSLPEDKRKIIFWADDTWGNAIEKVKDRAEAWSHQQERTERTRLLLHLRLTVLNNVLHQFLEFGTVGDLTEEDVELDKDSDSPWEQAAEVFDGKARKEGSKTRVHDDVIEWVVRAYDYFLAQEGLAAEKAKDAVMNIAERQNYHFTRRIMEEWIRLGRISESS